MSILCSSCAPSLTLTIDLGMGPSNVCSPIDRGSQNRYFSLAMISYCTSGYLRRTPSNMLFYIAADTRHQRLAHHHDMRCNTTPADMDPVRAISAGVICATAHDHSGDRHNALHHDAHCRPSCGCEVPPTPSFYPYFNASQNTYMLGGQSDF
ncbi:hypothetical protein B0H14DRAFT_345007 [Mycena olivaceomarginata]|nr:hypothetical protein B0H14DRAFT_345007 [Mycena olivaceomarginata]